jgi:hypothetical protein
MGILAFVFFGPGPEIQERYKQEQRAEVTAEEEIRQVKKVEKVSKKSEIVGRWDEKVDPRSRMALSYR